MCVCYKSTDLQEGIHSDTYFTRKNHSHYWEL